MWTCRVHDRKSRCFERRATPSRACLVLRTPTGDACVGSSFPPPSHGHSCIRRGLQIADVCTHNHCLFHARCFQRYPWRTTPLIGLCQNLRISQGSQVMAYVADMPPPTMMLCSSSPSLVASFLCLLCPSGMRGRSKRVMTRILARLFVRNAAPALFPATFFFASPVERFPCISFSPPFVAVRNLTNGTTKNVAHRCLPVKCTSTERHSLTLASLRPRLFVFRCAGDLLSTDTHNKKKR